MRWDRLIGLGLAIVISATRVSADTISDWNERALRAANSAHTNSFPELSEALAILNVAVFEAVNAIDRSYEPYVFRGLVPSGASAAAAALGAAHTVVTKLFPDQASLFGI